MSKLLDTLFKYRIFAYIYVAIKTVIITYLILTSLVVWNSFVLAFFILLSLVIILKTPKPFSVVGMCIGFGIYIGMFATSYNHEWHKADGHIFVNENGNLYKEKAGEENHIYILPESYEKIVDASSVIR